VSAWLHPLFGFLTVGLVVWLAARGLRSRQRHPDAAAARAAHRRASVPVWLLAVGLAVSGTASVAWLRDDLELAASAHFWAGWGLAIFLTLGFSSSRQFRSHPDARQVHAVLGVFTLLAAVTVLLLGLGLLP